MSSALTASAVITYRSHPLQLNVFRQTQEFWAKSRRNIEAVLPEMGLNLSDSVMPPMKIELRDSLAAEADMKESLSLSCGPISLGNFISL